METTKKDVLPWLFTKCKFLFDQPDFDQTLAWMKDQQKQLKYPGKYFLEFNLDNFLIFLLGNLLPTNIRPILSPTYFEFPGNMSTKGKSGMYYARYLITGCRIETRRDDGGKFLIGMEKMFLKIL